MSKMLDTLASTPPAESLSPWYHRLGLAAFVAFVAVGLGVELPAHALIALAGASVAVAASVALFVLRRGSPLVYATLATVGVILIANGEPANLAWFGLCLLGGWCALRMGVAAGLAYIAGILVLFANEWLWTVHDAGWFAWTAGVIFTVAAALLVLQQARLVAQLRALQVDLAQRTRTEERIRIAGELHDVIAHSLTVSLLHISSARLAVEHEPENAAKALGDAERLTRQSLADVRAVVSTVRTPGGEHMALPTPGVSDLPRLVADLRAAQADVSLLLEGDLDALPATTGSTVFRIVQESLTNASRHAPGAAVEVRIARHGQKVDVVVDSNGVPGRGIGMGLENMQQRAQAVGGSCSAGPGGRGWLVQASLPILLTMDGRSR